MTRTLAGLVGRVREPARPFVTFYDVATGERVELSAVTTANWVAKTANLLVDELDAGPSTRVRIGLPTHWLRVVWLLASWEVGAAVVSDAADIGVSGPELEADEPVRLASALRPFGLRFEQPPAGFVDLGVEVAGQPDVFGAFDPPTPQTPAVDLPGLSATHAELLRTPGDAARLLVTPGPVARDASLVVAAALGGGSLVLVAGGNAEPDQLERIAVQEQATARPPTV